MNKILSPFTFKDSDGKWPTDFNDKYHLQDQSTKNWWDVTLEVEEVSPQQFHEELKHKMAKYEFVVVYKSDGTSLHAVYVEKYKPVLQRVRCINSWGSKDPNPDLTIKDVLKLYRVKCSAINPQNQQLKKEEAAKIQSAWKENHRPSLAELKSASKLAKDGYLTSVEFLNLKKINICDIHSDQISKLSSIVSK